MDGSLPCSLVGTGDGGGGSDYLHQCTRTSILASEQDFCLFGAFSPNTVCARARARMHVCSLCNKFLMCQLRPLSVRSAEIWATPERTWNSYFLFFSFPSC